MIKPLLLCGAVALLTACAGAGKSPSAETSEPQAVAAGDPPHGVIKLLLDDEGGTYADLRAVSTWQGNSRLRRFYIINNYSKQTVIHQDPPLIITSSRANSVINCDTQERTLFDRIYFSKPYAQGDAIASSRQDAVGQWSAFPKESLIGIVAGMVCQLDPSRLKPEPPAQSEPTRLGAL